MQKKWWVLLAVASGTFMATLDTSVINISLPRLNDYFTTDLTHTKWVVLIYLLFITSLLLPFGRISDQYGRKKIFSCGFLVFTIGSFLCGISQTLFFLIFSRIIQALGASMLMANGPAVITGTFPAQERGRALGLLATAAGSGLIIGPSLGGWLIDSFDWQIIFFINIPIAIFSLILVFRFLQKDILPKKTLKFDWSGAILQSIILSGLLLIFDPPSILFSGEEIFSSTFRITMGIIIFFLTYAFIQIELKAAQPLFDFTLFQHKTFLNSNIAGFLFFLSYSSAFVLMPFFLIDAYSLTEVQAGLFMTAIPAIMLLSAPLSGRLSDRWGSRWLTGVGSLLNTLTLVFMGGISWTGIQKSTSPTTLIILLGSIGLALGLFQSPNNNAIMSSVPSQKLGTASALIATARNLGLVIGTALATALFSWKQYEGFSQIEAIHFSFKIAAIFGLMCVGVCFFKKSGPHWETDDGSL